jgi:TonB family protein
MLTPVVEMGNRLIARAPQFEVPGVLGGVPAGQVILNSQRDETVRQLAPGSVVQGTVSQAVAAAFAPEIPAPPVLNKVDPMYPALARQARIQGDVKLKVQIGTDGHIQRMEVISGHPLLVPPALDAVKQWVYGSVSAPGSFALTLPFRLDGGNAPLESLIPQSVGGVVGGVPGGVSGGVVGGIPNATPPRIRIGGAVQEAKLASKVDPVYPEAARAAGVEGEVVLDVTIGEDGRVQTAVPRDGNAQLATAAAEAVRQWVYKPTLLNGAPVTVLTTVTVPFKLQQ